MTAVLDLANPTIDGNLRILRQGEIVAAASTKDQRQITPPRRRFPARLLHGPKQRRRPEK